MSHCIDTSHFIYIHSSVVGYWVVSTFWLLWTMLLQILVYRFLCGHILLYGNSMFNLLRSCLTGFPKRLQHFTFHLPCMRVLVSPHPLQPFWSTFVILAILVCEMVSYCDFDFHFSDECAYCMLPLDKWLFKSFAHFLIELSFLLLSCTSSLCYRYKFRIRNIICKIFLPFCGLSLEAPPFLILMRFIFFFPLVCVLVPYLRNPQ